MIEEKGKILVVDDSPTILQMAKKILVSGGYEVHTAMFYSLAKKEIDNYNFDLILLDSTMKHCKSEDEAYESILKREGRTYKIALHSVTSEDKLKESAKKEGVNCYINGYIQKRDPEYLISRIEEILQNN